MGNAIEKFEELNHEEKVERIVEKINKWSDHVILQLGRAKKLKNISPHAFYDPKNFAKDKSMIKASWTSERKNPFKLCGYRSAVRITPRITTQAKELENCIVEECHLNYELTSLRRRHSLLITSLMALKELQKRRELDLNNSVKTLKRLKKELKSRKKSKGIKRSSPSQSKSTPMKKKRLRTRLMIFKVKDVQEPSIPVVEEDFIYPDDIQQEIEVETTENSKAEPKKKKRKMSKKHADGEDNSRAVSIIESDHMYAKRLPDSQSSDTEEEEDDKGLDLGVD